VSAPVIDRRQQADVLAELTGDLSGYTPEWSPGSTSPGLALMKIFARYASVLIGGLNRVPQRSLLAFLDTLGTHLLPAQAAEAPLVFTLAPNSPVDVTLPANSQVAAPPQSTVPSLSTSDPSQSSAKQPVLFATRESISLSRGQLAALYSIDPGSDQYADHSTSLTAGFTLFDNLTLTEHAIYLGHDTLFAFNGAITILLLIGLRVGTDTPLGIQWEYLAQTGWVPLTSAPEDDTTGGLHQDGTIVLQRDCGPPAKQDTFAGQTSYWLRGRLTTPLLPDQVGGKRTVPVINTVRVRLKLNKLGLPPEAAFADAVSLDVSKDFYPFGQQPAQFSTFYFASKEVFQRQAASVRVYFNLSNNGGAGDSLQLLWEFFDGSIWSRLIVSPDPSSSSAYKFTDNGTVSFQCPRNWQQTIVNGVKNYWLRVRIFKGDYGVPTHVTVDSSNHITGLVLSTVNPPVIHTMTLSYAYLTDPQLTDHCLSKNDFIFEDHTEASHWPDQTFVPFHTVADVQPAVHFGFDHPLPTGLASLYVDIPETVVQNGSNQASAFVWEYLSSNGWNELGLLDETQGFQSSGMLQFVGQPDAIAAPGLGGDLYWIRARLKPGEQLTPAAISGIWLNAVWASQRTSNATEIIGTGDGNPGQTFLIQHTPVLEGEVIEVQEWTGKGSGWQTALQDVPQTDLRFVRDPATSVVTAVWVRWYERPNLYNSGPRDRHYIIERATGFVRFGPPGMIPTAGNLISANYSSGGGVAGNVPAGAISELHTSVPYVMKVTNPIAASGGADTETTDSASLRGPQAIRNRGRAVSPSDFEWLARQASPDVGRVRCITITGPDGHAQRGWVTLLVAPRSLDAQPQPTPEFQLRILNYLQARAPFGAMRQIRIVGPNYSPVGVLAEVVTADVSQAAQLEAVLRSRLNAFLHPLTGGPLGQGWEFGQSVFLSQIATLIEATPGVDYAQGIVLRMNGQIFDDSVPVPRDSLIAAGTHELKLILAQV
jgi:hypothetical protein